MCFWFADIFEKSGGVVKERSLSLGERNFPNLVLKRLITSVSTRVSEAFGVAIVYDHFGIFSEIS